MRRFLLLSLTPTALFAQTDFNGSWVMNKAKSDFGNMPEQMVPEKLALKITSSESNLKTVTTQVGARGENTSEASYVLDGKTANANRGQGGEVKTIAKWDGADIAMTSSREVQGMTLTIEQKLTKTSADTLLMTTKVGGTPMGDIVMKYHLDRVPETAATAPASTATAATAPAAQAAAKPAAAAPSFAGTWKLNKAKSNFGQLPEEYQPTAATRIIANDEKVASVKSTQSGANGELKMDFELKLDGTETVNAQAKSVAKWDGPAIVVNTKRDTQGMTLDITEKWVKVNEAQMNVEMKIGGTPLGDIVMTYVFEKEL